MTAAPSALAVVTFNIRTASADSGVHAWPARAASVAARIRACRPDLVGLQECRDDGQAQDLRRRLPGCRWFGVRRGGGDESRVEMAPVLVCGKRFRVLRHGHFWFGDTPRRAGSRHRRGGWPRTATWVEVRARRDGGRLLFVNCHLDFQPAAGLAAAKQLRRWLRRHARRLPVVVAGDFNADKTSPVYRWLTADLIDVYRRARPLSWRAATFHGYGRVATAVDWLLASPGSVVRSALIDRRRDGGRYPSDHYPLSARLGGSRHRDRRR